MKFSKILSAAALSAAFLSQAANASSVLLNTTPVSAGLTTSSTFSITASGAHALFTLVYDSTNGTDALTSFDLYKVGTPLAINPDSFDSEDWYKVSEFYNLDAGNYYFTADVQGPGTIKVTTDAGVGVAPVIVTTPVPEPESLALALAGVCVAGTLLRRRRSM